MKLPFIQLYTADWIQDTRCLSLEARGAWIDILCAMQRSKTRGIISMSKAAFGRLLGATSEQTETVLNELSESLVCDTENNVNGNVTLTSRRMVREQRARDFGVSRVQRHRQQSKNQPVTPKKREETHDVNGEVTVQTLDTRHQTLDTRHHITDSEEVENCPQIPTGFETFWSIYPKKRGKTGALKSWRKIKPSEELIAKMVTTITWQKELPEWIKESGKFIPHPATWLNNGCWDDEPQSVKESASW